MLRQGILGRLAVVDLDGPDIFPINYAVDHASIVFRTAAGKKLSAAAHRPVAFEVDGYQAGDATAWSVVVRGRTQEIREKDEIIEAMSLSLLPWQEGRKPRYLRVVPAVVTGRRLHLSGGTGAA